MGAFPTGDHQLYVYETLAYRPRTDLGAGTLSNMQALLSAVPGVDTSCERGIPLAYPILAQ